VMRILNRLRRIAGSGTAHPHLVRDGRVSGAQAPAPRTAVETVR
jgi:hypothetical protein